MRERLVGEARELTQKNGAIDEGIRPGHHSSDKRSLISGQYELKMEILIHAEK